MRRLAIEQNTEEWFDFRRYKLGGSKIKGVRPLSRGKYKGLSEGAAGFWKLIAERLSLPKDGEDERARGHRLETRALELTNQKFGLSLEKGAIWQSETDERLYISPDGEDLSNITIAQETKAFDPDKHLRIIWEDIQAKKLFGYRPFDSIPDENQDQTLHYFSINQDLKKLYWALTSDMVAYEEMEHYCLVIERETIEAELTKHKEIEKLAIERTEFVVRELVDALVKGK